MVRAAPITPEPIAGREGAAGAAVPHPAGCASATAAGATTYVEPVKAALTGMTGLGHDRVPRRAAGKDSPAGRIDCLMSPAKIAVPDSKDGLTSIWM